MKPRLVKDSRGEKSWTISMVLPAVLLLMGKFALSGIRYGDTTFASMDPLSFGMSFAAIVGTLVARDTMKYHYPNWRNNHRRHGNDDYRPDYS